MQRQNSTRRSARRVGYEFTDRVRSTAQGHWHSILLRLVPGSLLTGEAGVCPACGCSFRLLDDDRSRFLCRGAGRPDATGDGFAALMHLARLNFRQAVEAAAEALNLSDLPDAPDASRTHWRRTGLLRPEAQR